MAEISQAAIDLIIEYEVSSEAVYTKKYQRPTWPGEQSGATIGIGFDVGQSSKSDVVTAWSGILSDDVIDVLESVTGMTGKRGETATRNIRSKVLVTWAQAYKEFSEHEMPKWINVVQKALPNTDKLNGDCLGALVSLTYNRGPSFNASGDRYREMRGIKVCMADQDFAQIPGLIRSMKRLWPHVKGLLRRRDAEAALFAKGLQEAPAAPEVAQAEPPVEPAGGTT